MVVTVEELNYRGFIEISDAEYKDILRKSGEIMKNEKMRSRIYFILAKDTAIKIGFTLDVERRFYRMQMDCPIELLLVGVIKGDRTLEVKLHKKFKKYRLRGEWFKINDKIINYAKEKTININKSYRLKKIPKL